MTREQSRGRCRLARSSAASSVTDIVVDRWLNTKCSSRLGWPLATPPRVAACHLRGARASAGPDTSSHGATHTRWHDSRLACVHAGTHTQSLPSPFSPSLSSVAGGWVTNCRPGLRAQASGWRSTPDSLTRLLSAAVAARRGISYHREMAGDSACARLGRVSRQRGRGGGRCLLSPLHVTWT